METETLEEYVKDQSTYIPIESGDSYIGIYKGVEFIEKDSFGELKKYARYLLEDLEDKRVRNFDSQSISLAKQMTKISVEAMIKISRTGEGTNTRYSVEAVKKVATKKKD